MNNTINRYLAILCSPLASLDFFLEDYFEKIIQKKQGKSGIDKKLEQEVKETIIQYIQKRFQIYSYDEIYMYLEKCYLYSLRTLEYKNSFQLYLKCLQNIMKAMISQRDGKIVFKYWKSTQDKEFLGGFGDANKIFLFHSMNMHIPLDFIVMYYMVQNPENNIKSLDNYYGQIEIADQQLDIVLKSGVAENHLHKGVSVSFFEIWEAFMLPISVQHSREYEALNVGLGDGNRKDGEILFFLFVAAIVRVWIALEVRSDMQDRKKVAIWAISEEESEQHKNMEQLRRLISAFERGKPLEEWYREAWGSLDEKTAKHEMVTYCQELWETILLILPQQQEGTTIMQGIFEVSHDIHTSDENIFLFHAMKYIKEKEEYSTASGRESKVIRCMLQYLRIKNYIFGCVVQKKTIRGLDYFQKEYYSKDSKMNRFFGTVSRNPHNRKGQVVYWEQAMRKQFQNRDLKKIEFRASIDERDSQFRKNIKAFLEAYRNIIREDYCREEDGRIKVYRPFPRVGLIFHLLKQKDDTVPEKCFLDGLEDSEKKQFGILTEKYDEQIIRMRKIREEIPGLDRYIVGIDAASLENSTPVWVFANAYENARDSQIERVGYEQTGSQSLRFTFHAGEDFRHLLSGLRRIDEAITFLKFHAGDRIGHGIALGIMPERWKQYNPFVVLPRIEALENYVWAYYVLSDDSVDFPATLMAYIERRVYELAKEIYGKSQGISMQILVEGYLELFRKREKEEFEECAKAKDIGFCEAIRNGNCDEIIWNGEKIALARHCKKFLLEMERPIHYEVTSQDIQIIETVQLSLRRKLGSKGIVVEVNPSSNVAIGEVDKLTESQIYQLNYPGGENNVMVCINSDDPTVFHTNVSNELSYIYYGMLQNTISREVALEWIDKVRECGIKSSFIQIRETDQQMYEMLEKLLEYL